MHLSTAYGLEINLFPLPSGVWYTIDRQPVKKCLKQSEMSDRFTEV